MKYQKGFNSDIEGDRVDRRTTINDKGGGVYPLVHSSSVPTDAHDANNWPAVYSRSSSISAESYYPSSSEETITKDSEDDCDEDDDPWSDSYSPKYKVPGSADIKDIIGSSYVDREKTPIMSKESQMSSFTMEDLIKASNHLKDQDRKQLNKAYQHRLEVYPATVIQEKSIPAVAMSRRRQEEQTSNLAQRPPSRSSTSGQRGNEEQMSLAERPQSRTSSTADVDSGRGAVRKRYPAPGPPPQGNPILQTHSTKPHQSYPRGLGSTHHDSRPESPQYSEPIQARAFGKRADLSSTAILNYPLTSRNFTSPEDIRVMRTYEKEEDGSIETPRQSRETPVQATAPAFSYPVMKSLSGSSSYKKRTKEQKRNIIEEKQRLMGASVTQRNDERYSDDDTHRQLNRSNPQTPIPPSNTGTCPHCKIHSWLPHSAGCPNAQNIVKKSSSSAALYRK